MEREDRVPVLQPVERRDRVPVMEVEDVEFCLPVGLVELLHHRVAHILAVLYRIAPLRAAVMVVDSLDRLVLHRTAGEIVYLVILCQGLGKVGRGIRKAAHPFGVHRFPAEERYLK